ncbi:uncharacterized protein J4E87_001474 [Alternaria ethzedia]|uniref:uncharacterized protein n=1 Tax=Alternaria ethzedia TaxID=181014 RepID=UPI0020C55555|nr:uncharacterized protein J4E87_001474 [Alternaria ethzedia]KAI4634301.1 hypothetical protein J4E87_001474 [Alternaria ethzedia]
MTTHTTTTLLAYKATSPAWPTTPALTTINLGRDIAMEVLATEAHQDRLRALQEDELKELETISGELLLCVQRFEAFLARWDGEVLGLEEKRDEGGEEMEEEEKEEGELEEGEMMEDDDDDDSPPRERRRFDNSPSPSPEYMRRPVVYRDYQNVRGTDPNAISVGDIGWAPLPRMAATARATHVPSQYGQIVIKVYPFIIVKKMADCMIGVVISSAGGNGLRHKQDSLRARSTCVVEEGSRGPTNVSYGWAMGPRLDLEVDGTSAYRPVPGAFVDVLDSHQIPYNMRWKADGRLTHVSRGNLWKMRFALMRAEPLGV